MKFSLLAAASLVASVNAEIYLKEQFNDKDWETRWTQPTKWRKKTEMGPWERTAGEFYGNKDDTGIQTGEDARFFGISSPLEKTFFSADKELVIQYSVKHEQGIDCGGAYIKMLSGDLSRMLPGEFKMLPGEFRSKVSEELSKRMLSGDLKAGPGVFDADKFGGETPYAIMFGPDICGGTKRTHVILNSEKKKENLMINNDIPCETDKLSHLYTLVIRPDNTFEVFVDNKSVRSGDLADEFDFLEPKEILDPAVSKPEDWVDNPEMVDPESVKPEGYDDIPAEIPDPEATKPDDWDDEDDGEWEAPMIDNPEYQGPWTPNMVPNPDYKGPWVHPKIPNPDYVFDEKMYAVCANGCSHIGFELWQVKSGTIFDDIIITDNLEEAQKFAEETFFAKKDGEKQMYDEDVERERKAMEDDMDDEDDYDMEEEF